MCVCVQYIHIRYKIGRTASIYIRRKSEGRSIKSSAEMTTESKHEKREIKKKSKMKNDFSVREMLTHKYALRSRGLLSSSSSFVVSVAIAFTLYSLYLSFVL